MRESSPLWLDVIAQQRRSSKVFSFTFCQDSLYFFVRIIVSVDVADMDLIVLQNEVLVLRKRVARLVALLRLMVVRLKVIGASLNYTRISDGSSKVSLLRAIERSRSVPPLRSVLRVLRLPRSRYHSWKREVECSLDDMPSCPRTSPQQLTSTEVDTINMVTSDEYRHVPTATLAILAQRIGSVFASPIMLMESEYPMYTS